MGLHKKKLPRDMAEKMWVKEPLVNKFRISKDCTQIYAATFNIHAEKFNGSLLQDINYVTLVKKVIDETVVINKKAMPQLLWDTVKDQIRGSTIKYSSTKKKKEM